MDSKIISNNRPKLFKNLSKIAKIKLPLLVVNNIVTENPNIQIKVVDFLRENPNFDEIDDESGSNREIAEVIPAIKIHKKNIGPKIYAYEPITLKTCGNAIKAKPVPSTISLSIGIPDENVIKPKIENTPIALKTSKPEFESNTIKEFLVKLEPFGR